MLLFKHLLRSLEVETGGTRLRHLSYRVQDGTSGAKRSYLHRHDVRRRKEEDAQKFPPELELDLRFTVAQALQLFPLVDPRAVPPSLLLEKL